MNHTLSVNGLRKSYGAHSVLDITMSIPAGEFCLIVGENGAGKSTFFKCLLGLENYQGQISIAGRNTMTGAVAGVLDHPLLYPRWSVARNAAYFVGDARAADSAVFSRLVPRSLLRQPTGTLSTGQRKLVTLAIALTGSSPIVLLDEFANGLDREARARFRAVLADELACGQRTFLATGHELDAFADLPTTVFSLVKGTLTDVTAEYFAANNLEEFYEHVVGRAQA